MHLTIITRPPSKTRQWKFQENQRKQQWKIKGRQIGDYWDKEQSKDFDEAAEERSRFSKQTRDNVKKGERDKAR